ncbi:GerW family sporulation protein [Clostridium sp. Mt-5]|uniref:GerW family sporulation protein n=1 Tax=Clostridium moutaii TaxID=3240932 RepID=A0ABV4BNE8_9CLOT
MDIKENAEMLFSKLENFLKTETVVGKPINVGDIILVPFITVNFGCATGGGGQEAAADKQEGSGAGMGAGAKITADAVLVIKDDTVKVIPIKSKDNLDKIIELVPGIIKKMGIKKNKDKEEK